MNSDKWYLPLHWTARIFGLLVAGFVFLCFFGEGTGQRGDPYTLTLSHVGLEDGALLLLVLACATALLLAWIWERSAAIADVVLAAVFLVCCATVPGMHAVWFLGVALIVPGLLYLGAAVVHRDHRAHAN